MINKFNFQTLPLFIWGTIILIGIVLFLNNTLGYLIITLIGTGGFSAYSIYCFQKLKGKNMLYNILSILSFLWLVFITYNMFFNYGHPYNVNGLAIFFLIFTICLIYYIERGNKRNI